MATTSIKKAPSPAQKKARALFAKRAKAGEFVRSKRKTVAKRAKVNPVLPLSFKTPKQSMQIKAKYFVYFLALDSSKGDDWIFNAAFVQNQAAKKYAQTLSDDLQVQVQIELKD